MAGKLPHLPAAWSTCSIDGSGLRILILKPSSLGDVIHAIPVLRLLRLRFPKAWIAWWVETSLGDLLRGDPDLDEVIPFDRAGLCTLSGVGGLIRSIRSMRRQRFDWVIDLQGLARSGLVAWAARGKLTVGVEDPREGASAFYDVRVSRPSWTTHAVDWYLEVLRVLGVPVHDRFQWLPKRGEPARSIEAAKRGLFESWICVHPGARWWNKRYPIEKFESAMKEVASQWPEVGFVILGGAGDMLMADRLCAVAPDRSLNLTGKTTLPEMVEWIRSCRVMLTNDTGPMHVAAAMKKPVVALFGPTSPYRTGPYRQEADVIQASLPCVPCMKSRCSRPLAIECLHSIPPEAPAERISACLSDLQPATAAGVHAF
ncbi:MAG: glycosyltransferase family 9 protein [Verrucomicrobia bacterium]|nr:glycosyltransferase family 9 protein [Verrucomicrobiota bacterium]